MEIDLNVLTKQNIWPLLFSISTASILKEKISEFILYVKSLELSIMLENIEPIISEKYVDVECSHTHGYKRNDDTRKIKVFVESFYFVLYVIIN